MQEYTVKKGDSLYSIAKNYNVTVDDIKTLNNLQTNTLQIGQILRIPSQSESNQTTYVVKRGDTLYGIANQFGVSITDLSNLNNLNTTNLQIGQVLKIPTTSGINPETTFVYTVKAGDSLWSIAKRYETTVNDIIKINNLGNTNLSIGQQLTIPESGTTVEILPTYINYTVKRGDNLYSIARKYNLTVDEIVKDNNLSSNTLSIGQVLIIRTSNEDKIVEECFGEEYTPPTSDITYVVQKGDSLYSIAKKYNTSVDNIKKKNNLTNNSLAIGQILKI